MNADREKQDPQRFEVRENPNTFFFTENIKFPENFLQFHRVSFNLIGMTKPFAFVFYEKLLPGQPLANRLQDLGYRVQVVNDASSIEQQALQQKPMFLVTEFPRTKSAVPDAIAALKKNPETAHIPVMAYIAGTNSTLRENARSAGATLVASESGLLEQLPQLLEHLLQVE